MLRALVARLEPSDALLRVVARVFEQSGVVNGGSATPSSTPIGRTGSSLGLKTRTKRSAPMGRSASLSSTRPSPRRRAGPKSTSPCGAWPTTKTCAARIVSRPVAADADVGSSQVACGTCRRACCNELSRFAAPLFGRTRSQECTRNEGELPCGRPPHGFVDGIRLGSDRLLEL